MSPLILPIGATAALALAAVALSIFTLFQARAVSSTPRDSFASLRSEMEAEISGLRASVDACSAEIRRLEQQNAASPAPHGHRPALNLGKRSQAIRMHRRGDSPDTIAAALEVPRGEVDLLLKVHRIVIGSIGN